MDTLDKAMRLISILLAFLIIANLANCITRIISDNDTLILKQRFYKSLN